MSTIDQVRIAALGLSALTFLMGVTLGVMMGAAVRLNLKRKLARARSALMERISNG